MKHLFLPLPIDFVRSAWEDWRRSNSQPDANVRLVEVRGGCFLVTEQGRPPRFFVDLLKNALERQQPTLGRAG